MNFCICCGSKKLSAESFKNGYKIIKCNDCGYFSCFPKPTNNLLKKLYLKDYFVKKEKGKSKYDYGYQNVNSVEFIRASEEISRKRLEIIKQRTNINNKSLLDLGCASGIFLKIANKYGWKTYGVEINPLMAKRAENYTKISVQKDIDYFVKNKYKFDVVTMWEYLEHLIRPEEEIAKIKKILNPGGLICISFPNFTCLKGKKKNYKWEHYKPPEHLNYWTDKTIKLFLSHNGFKNIAYRFFGFSPILTLVNNRDKKLRLKKTSFLINNIWYRTLNKIFKYETGVIERPSIFQSALYEGIEIYANSINM